MMWLLDHLASGAADLYIRAASLIIGPVLGLAVYAAAWIVGEPQ
jgi:hypothetical protein